jgi:PGF-CTERM protein
MKKKIAVGMFLILAIALALGFAQLYLGASEAAEMECEGGGGGGGEAISPNETEYEDVALIKAEIEKLREVPEMRIGGTSTDSSARKTVTLWVYGLTPENQRLDGTMIDGWKLIIAQSPMPADQNKSLEIAEEYLLNSPTFRFDGIEDSLKLVDTNTLDCPDCWEFVFEFQCRHAGYGNRAGQMLAQVITPHTAKIVIEQGRVTSAIMDEKWDMLEQKMIDSNKPIISVSSTVFEGERGMDIFDDGNVTCYSDHYYPGYKEIVTKEGHISKAEIDALLELFSNLSEYSYTVNASKQLTSDHMNCIFDPVGGGTSISCIPLNKTLSIRLTLFPGTETATPTAKEIVKRIDKIFREAEVPEKKKEINPYCISLNLEPSAESYHVNQMIIFNASLEDGWLGNVSSYEWDFGDGSKGYGETVRHAYALEGDYAVKLTVITSDGAVGKKCKTITVIRSAHTPVQSSEVPGFVAVFTIAVLLAVAYLLRRRK